jgi:Phosphotransferase enzyme family
MTRGWATVPGWVPANPELRTLLERVLGRPLQHARARPYAYRSSYPLLEIEVDDELFLLKDLSGSDPAKPAFLQDPLREAEVYRRILAPAGIGPRFHGAEGARLVLEKLDAVELWRLGHEGWVRTARWLADAHETLAAAAAEACLLRLDESYYRRWPRCARLSPAMAAPYRHAVSRLVALPVVVIHHEFYPSNVLVADDHIAPVDWELAAAGPAVLDLAALVTGWDGEQLDAILRAYGPVDVQDLAAARLHLAVRWLGWSRDWEPPLEHRRDWLAEATAAADQLR